jgi:hypothetical protein
MAGLSILSRMVETSSPVLLMAAARRPIVIGSRLRLIWGYRRRNVENRRQPW